MDALQIANELNRIYDTALTNDLVAALQPDPRLIDVELLCVTCRGPIKARIHTSQWIRVEWIGPDGQCKTCYDKQRVDAMTLRELIVQVTGISPEQTVLDLDHPILGYELAPVAQLRLGYKQLVDVRLSDINKAIVLIHEGN